MYKSADLSRECNGSNVAKLISAGARLIGERPWSTLPGEKPHLDGRALPAPGRRHAVEDLLVSVSAANDGENDAVIWVPPGAGLIARSSGSGSYANLRWGFTVHVLDDRLIALQRVVFLDTKARRLAIKPRLLLVTVPKFYASSWNGMAASRTPRLFN